jgi:bifunctional non-homologous end joining protein LigD
MTPALMLATPTSGPPEAVITRLLQDNCWSFEFKMDGIRALLHVSGGKVTITNRNGRDITYRYPDVVRTATGLGDMVLDGEIVCPDADGRPDFGRVQRRDAQGSERAAATMAARFPAQFVVFDVLIRAGVDCRALSYLGRREQLGELAAGLQMHSITSPPVSVDGAMMWRVVCDMGLEGLVAKRHDGRYVGRRSSAWLKVKRTHRISAVVVGYDAGEGSRAGVFGALKLGLLDPVSGATVGIGSVGSGFSNADIAEIWGMLQRREPIVVEVTFLEIGSGRRLRQPVFAGLRRDLAVDDCTVDQVGGPPNE